MYLLQVVQYGKIYYIDTENYLTVKKSKARVLSAKQANILKKDICNEYTDCQLIFIGHGNPIR
jgi:hypothetical protein